MLYLQGKEIKDPQTGQSLGNMETPCGEVVITRVTPKLSYGILEKVSIDLTNVQPGALLVKEEIPASAIKSAGATQQKLAWVLKNSYRPLLQSKNKRSRRNRR